MGNEVRPAGNVEAARQCNDEVDDRLREYEFLVNRISIVAPDFIAANFAYDSGVPIAVVCLRDCQTTLGQALFALHQLCLQTAEHRTADPPDPLRVAWIERFFLEDAAMRLYSAAEHLANAIAFLLAIDQDEIDAFKTPSQWERVRKALEAHGTDTPIGTCMADLRRVKGWRVAMRYRGRVVHNQPPNLEGLGIQYKRQKRWEATPDRSHMVLRVRFGDAADHTPAEVKEFILEAFAAFLAVARAVTDNLYSELDAHGIKWDGNESFVLNPFFSAECGRSP